jgi:hypothetical protein
MRVVLAWCVAAAVFLSAAAANGAAIYWNLFNIEGESSVNATYITYTTPADMLNDTNRTGNFDHDGSVAGQNVVGSGATIARDPIPVPEPAAG